jgi:hypothetical protein
MKHFIKKLLRESINGLKQISLKDAISISQVDDINHVGEWLKKPIDDIQFFYKLEPIGLFENVIKEMESSYDEFPKDKIRTKKIFKLLNAGEKPMPIFVELDDTNKFILEGRHRIVAFYWAKIHNVPVIYVK